MAINFKKISDKLDKALSETTKSEFLELMKDRLNSPKGWVDIEKHLPQCLVMDYMDKGYTVYKVKNKDGCEFFSCVSDTKIWYENAKKIGITHWWGE